MLLGCTSVTTTYSLLVPSRMPLSYVPNTMVASPAERAIATIAAASRSMVRWSMASTVAEGHRQARQGNAGSGLRERAAGRRRFLRARWRGDQLGTSPFTSADASSWGRPSALPSLGGDGHRRADRGRGRGRLHRLRDAAGGTFAGATRAARRDRGRSGRDRTTDRVSWRDA